MTLRVLHVITGLGRGGAEAMLVKLAKTMDRDQVRSFVVSVKDRGALAAALEATGVSVDVLDIRGIPQLPGGMRRLRRIVAEVQPDIVQGWMYHGNLAAMYAARRAACPVVWGIRQSLYRIEDERRATRAVIRTGAALSQRAAAIVYNSDMGKEHHVRLGYAAEKSLVIPNGFNTASFQPDRVRRAEYRRAWGLTDEHEVLLLPARWHPVKDHLTFLDAAALIVAGRPQARFVFAGTGTDRANDVLTEAIRARRLDDHCILLGEVAAMAGVYAAADLVCLSSINEGFPNVLGEALATEVPCVTTDVGDARLVVGEAGRTVPTRDPAAFAAACLELLERGAPYRSALGSLGRAQVLDNYRIEGVAGRFVDLYRRLVRGPTNKVAS